MEKVFEIVSNISTPLALAGVVLAVVFFVLKEVVQKGIFPELSKSAASPLIKLIFEKLYVLALVSIILAFIGYTASLITDYLRDSKVALSPTSATGLQMSQSTAAPSSPAPIPVTSPSVKENHSGESGQGSPSSKRGEFTPTPLSYVVTLIIPSNMVGGTIKVDGKQASIKEAEKQVIKIEVKQKNENHIFTIHKEGQPDCKPAYRLIQKNTEIYLCQ